MIFLTHGIQVTFGMEKTFPDSSKLHSDQALLALYRAGDGDAAAVLLSRYIPLINRYAYQFRSVLDPDDLIQEGSIGFLDAVRTYDLASAAQFSSYASVCIRNRMLKAVEKNSSKKAGILNNSISLDEIGESSDGLTPEKIFIEKESFAAVLGDVNNVLSPLERKVLFSHLGGCDRNTIAESLHISLKSVDNALQRVRRKLKSIHRA